MRLAAWQAQSAGGLLRSSSSSRPSLRVPRTPAARRRHPSTITQAKKQEQQFGLGDDLLDFVLAGPKLRKWYGQGERELPKDGRDADQEPEPEDEFEEEEEGDGNAILVTDADTPSGEQVLLQLILARAALRVLVKDPMATQTAYGPYVYPIRSDTSDERIMKIALRGAGSVVCLGKLGALPQTLKAANIFHVVLLSSVGMPQESGFFSMFSGDGGVAGLRDPSREEAIMNSGVRYTIIRVAGLTDVPGGQTGLSLIPVDVGAQQGTAGSNGQGTVQQEQRVSREDVAALIVNALLRPPATEGRAFQVVSNSSSPPPKSSSDWTELLSPFSCMTMEESGEGGEDEAE